MIEELLERADPRMVRAFGEYFARLGASLLSKADGALEFERIHARQRERKTNRRRIASQVTAKVEAGGDLDEVIAEVAARHTMDEEQLRLWVKMQQQPSVTRAVRDRNIMLHASRGYTDAEIGAKFNLHPKSANRIVRRMIKAGRAPVAREVSHV